MEKEKSFGKFVKDKRQFFGLTQAELARRVGCATITIRKIEADAIRPSVQIGELLAVALNIPLEERAAFVRRARQPIGTTPEPPPTPTPYPSPDEIGSEDLSGRAVRGYQLADRIGEGGFGAVYRAVQPNIEREVAIKIILPRYANNPDFIRRFEAEAQMVARLEHPFIVPLYDYWREPNAAYLVMRLLRGGSLKDELKDGALPVERVIYVIEQISLALHTAHRFGVIHRDLKPANILLDEDRNAYLADFGIAKNLSDPDMVDHTQTGALIGSFPYLSPEQIRSEPIRPQADIYSLGVLIFQLLTGSLPFQGPTPIDYIQQHLGQPLPTLREYDPDLSPSLEKVIQRATAKNISQRYSDVLVFLREIRDAISGIETPTYLHLDNMDQVEIDSEKIENPFKGLRPFGEADTLDFFGRDTLIQELLSQMAEESDLGRFLAVVGPSGSGKSSVVNAGLIPTLRRGGLPGSENWFIVNFSPGPHPFDALEAALLRVAVNPPSSLLEQLVSSERGFMRAVQRVLPQDDSVELVLVIDQFEELFTLVQDETIRSRFFANLVTLVMDTNSRCRVLITLRADFIDRPLEYVDLGELIRDRNVFVLPLTADEIEEAVVKPAVRVGLFPESGLVNRIVRQLGDQPGMLPLLQHTLGQLYEHREGNRLTVEAYEEIGGVLGSLGRSAEEAYSSLSESEQVAVRQVFLRLVTLGDGVEDTRRRVLRTELEGLTAKETEEERVRRNQIRIGSDEVEAVIEAFGKYRLLTFDHDPITRTPTVEVAHEALLREWPRLRRWLDESRADVRTQRQLARSAEEWETSGRDNSFLIPGGAKLERFTTWYAGTSVILTRVEQDYLEASVLADEQQKQHQVQQERTRQKLKRAFIGVLLIGLIVAIGLSVFAFGQRRLANEQRQEALRQASIGLAALAEKELGGVDQERSVLLALEAVENYPFTPQAAGALAQSIEEFRAFRILEPSKSVTGLISVAAFSPSGERIAGATSPSPDSVAIWDAATGSELLSVNSHGDLCQEEFNLFHDLAWAPTGDRLAVVAKDTNSGAGCGTVVLDATSGERLLVLNDYESAVRSLDWSPDGSVLLAGHESGIVRMWNAQSGAEISALSDHKGQALDAVFSPDGRRIASASEDGTARIWDTETGKTQMVLYGHAGAVKSVDWSPDGTHLVTGGSDGLPRVWDASSGDVLLTLPGHIEEVVIVTWSADGRRIASQGLDAVIKVWDAATGGLLFQITNAAPEPSTKRGFVEFSPDGDWILAGGTRVLGLRLWDASIPVPKLFGHTFGQEWGGWSPDGTLIATSGEDGSARMWDAFTGQQVGEFPGGSYWGRWSPDGTRLVFSDGIGAYALNVWDVKSGDILATLSVPEDEYGAHQFLTVDWSPDSSRIAAADFRPGTSPQALYIWDAKSGELISTFHTDDNCMLGWPRWSPDSTRIATGCIFVEAGINTPARIWDVLSGQEIKRLESDFGWTYRTVWSPDGTRILVGYEQGVLRIWDVETGEPLITFAGHQGSTGGEWSPDGTLIASSGFANKSVKIWDAETGEEFLSFFVAGAPLSNEWSPDGMHVIVTGDGLNEPVIKQVWHSTEELIEFARECCVSRELTPEEREQFGLSVLP